MQVNLDIWGLVLSHLPLNEIVGTAAVLSPFFYKASKLAVERCDDVDLSKAGPDLPSAVSVLSTRYASHWRQLRSLQLYGSTISLDVMKQVRAIAADGRLSELHIESKTLNDRMLGVLADTDTLGGLRSLSLPSCPRITSTGLTAVFSITPNLQELDVSACSRLTDDVIIAAAYKCPELLSVKVVQCFRLTNQSLRHLGSCPKLVSIVADRCLKFTNLGFQSLGTRLGSLRVLDFSSCLKLGTAGVSALVHGSKGSLTSLNVSGCSAMSDPAMHAIVDAVGPRLRFLGAAGCNRLTKASLCRLAECVSLAHLKLGKVSDVDDSVMEAVGGLPLQSLAVNGCTAVTDSGLDAVTSPLLRRLNLEYCYNVTDTGFIGLIKRCPQLRVCNLRILERLTIASFEEMAARLPELAVVKLSGIHTQTETAAMITTLRTARPGITVCI